MQTYQQSLLMFLFLMGSYRVGWGQEHLPAIPHPDEARQAISLDMAGNTPFLGVSYHHQIIQLATKRQPNAGAVELNVGAGFVPEICIFGPCGGNIHLSTYHSLLLLWGHKVQGEFGYAGFLTQKGLLYGQAYVPGATVGLRFSPGAWLSRLYFANMIILENGTGITATGDLVWQKKTYLWPIPGLSFGRRF